MAQGGDGKAQRNTIESRYIRSRARARTHTHTPSHTHSHTHSHTYLLTHSPVRHHLPIYTHTHTHTHTHIHTHVGSPAHHLLIARFHRFASQPKILPSQSGLRVQKKNYVCKKKLRVQKTNSPFSIWITCARARECVFVVCLWCVCGVFVVRECAFAACL